MSGEFRVIIAGRAPLTVVLPLPVAPITLWRRLGRGFDERVSYEVRTQS